MRFVFVNSNKSIVEKFQKGFDEIGKVIPSRVSLECFDGDLAKLVASIPEDPTQKTAVVSPANSLSFMGGGFDRAIAELFTGGEGDYRSFESTIQTYALDRCNGFLPPQSASIVDLRKAFSFSGQAPKNENILKISHLVQIPTMAVPESVSAPTVFYCMWNMLLAVDGKFDTVIFPAMGAGYGGISPEIVARISCGAIGIFFMELELETPVNRGAAVLLFLKKNYKAFENAGDISKIEAILSSHAIAIENENENYESFIGESENGVCEKGPMQWATFLQCLSSFRGSEGP